MKIIDYDDMMYIMLRELDYHSSNANIGLRLKDQPFTKSDANRLIFNNWINNNNYYLIIDKISKESIESLMVLTPCLKGIVLNFSILPKEADTIINYALYQNLLCYAVLEDHKNLNENIILKESIYEI